MNKTLIRENQSFPALQTPFLEMRQISLRSCLRCPGQVSMLRVGTIPGLSQGNTDALTIINPGREPKTHRVLPSLQPSSQCPDQLVEQSAPRFRQALIMSLRNAREIQQQQSSNFTGGSNSTN